MSDREYDVTTERAAWARRKAWLDGVTDEYGARRARRSLPTDVDVSRSLTFPTRLTAKREFLVREPCACGADCLVCACESSRGTTWARAKPGPAGAGDQPGTEFVHLAGVASVTDTPYEMWDFYGPYVERVARDAFSDSLTRQPDVAFLANHEGLSMARTRAGTLLLSVTNEGLTADAWLNPVRSDVANLISAVQSGCVDQMSFGAVLEDGVWNEDFTEFTLTRLDLNCGDVSAVNFGANPHTSIAARARRAVDQVDRMPEVAARAAWRSLERRFRGESPVTRDAEPAVAKDQKPGRSVALTRSALLAQLDEDYD